MKSYTGNFTYPVSELKTGNRFYHAGMWHDFQSAEEKNGFIKVATTNGYNERIFFLILKKNDKVILSRSSCN
jgi:hypothetical protein